MSIKLAFYIRLGLLVLVFVFVSCLTLILSPFLVLTDTLNVFFAHSFGFLSCLVLGYRVQVQHPERLTSSQPCIYIGNHQSIIDVMTYGSLLPLKTVSIGKKELLFYPLFGVLFYLGRNIFIDRKRSRQAYESIDSAVQAMIQRQASVWIFPEGTRNRGKVRLLPFKRGAFVLACKTGFPIVPLIHQPLQTYFDYSKLQFKPGPIQIKVLDPVFPQGKSPEELLKEVYQILENELALMGPML